MMKRIAKSLCCALLGAAMALQLLTPAAFAEEGKEEKPDGKTELQVVLRAPVLEKGKDGKAALKLDEKKQPVYEDVKDPAASFGKDSGLAVGIHGRPGEKPAESPAPTEAPKAASPSELTLKMTVDDLRKGGLYVMPPKGYFVQAIYLTDGPAPQAGGEPDSLSREKTKKQELKNLAALAEASAKDASVYLPKELFQSKEGGKSLFPETTKALTLTVVLGRLDEKAAIELQYQAGEFRTDEALFEKDDVFPLDKTHKVPALSEELLRRAEEQGLSFLGWQLVYGTALPKRGDEKTLQDSTAPRLTSCGT